MSIRRWAARLSLAASCLFPAAVRADPPPVYEVLFTHIEDNTPGGALGSTQSRQNYLLYRGKLISMANLARSSGVPWSLQPDWKFLEAALLYEDATLMATTNNKNLLRYLKEDLSAVIDAHSHENGGYNYTDVAHLLDSLGVGSTTVIGGHIWDPTLPQFQQWDRFRVPVQGEKYRLAWWRGDILMGSGTPNHVNDPVVSGVWKPRDRDHYFEHDSTANIAAIGQFTGALNDVRELRSMYLAGVVPTQFMLTTSNHIKPSTITRTGGLAAIADSVINPLLAMRDSGMVVLTDFTSLVQTWQSAFGSRGFIFDAAGAVAVPGESSKPSARPAIGPCIPNPLSSETVIRYSLPHAAWVRLAVFDVGGRRVALLADGVQSAGSHEVRWSAHRMTSGLYFCRLEARRADGAEGVAAVSRRLVVAR